MKLLKKQIFSAVEIYGVRLCEKTTEKIKSHQSQNKISVVQK
jgi:hypothetical protein